MGARASSARLLAAVCAVACAACARPRPPEEAVSDLSPLVVLDDDDDPPTICGYGRFDRDRRKALPSCAVPRREVRAFGPIPREPPPPGRCPIGVRVVGESLVVEPRGVGRTFDPLPFRTCVPLAFAIGARHVLAVDDGYLVAYDSPMQSEVLWADEEGRETKLVSRARIGGFARGASGAPIAIAIGRARLGRGAVVTFDHAGRGAWTLRILTPLPIEPQPVAFDDAAGGVIGFAGGFVFRADERGRVENLRYVARDVGRVASIARTRAGVVYLGLECGVLRLDARPMTSEQWWSARDGASGRWRECAGPGSSS